jgi:hypothetical protein
MKEPIIIDGRIIDLQEAEKQKRAENMEKRLI